VAGIMPLPVREVRRGHGLHSQGRPVPVLHLPGEGLDGLVRLHNADTIDERQLSEGPKDLREPLAVVERQAAALAPRSPLAGIAGRDDVQDVWDKMSLEQHRAIIRPLMTVTIRQAVKPNGGRPKGWQPGQPYFDRNRVQITCNAGPAPAAA
jgi:hypothetical protein